MVAPQKHQLVGQVIAGRYRVIELLGEGGMGAVYAAEHLALHKRVALKIVHPEHAGNDDLAARFAREAMATSRIDHPNVISAIDFGRLDDGTAYLAVQLVRGPSLTKTLEAEGRLHWARAADLAAQIADALSAAHSHGIIHRDLKPDNVLLQTLEDGEELVKVLDFGVARFSREGSVPIPALDAQKVTQAGLIIGTPGYMSPEQAIGKIADASADLYALGVILWEAITGKPLWDGDDLQQLVEKQLGHDAPTLRGARNDQSIPHALDELVALLLARRPEERPQEALAVRDQLREISLMHEGERPRFRSGLQRARPMTPAREPVVLGNFTATPTPVAKNLIVGTPEVTEPTLSATKRTGSRSAWWFAALAGIVIAAATALVWTGQIEIRPSAGVAEVANSVAKQLNMDPPVLDTVPSSSAQRAGLPDKLVPVFERLIVAESREDRVGAAQELLGHVPIDEVPSYVRRMAYLQQAETCKAKRSELDELEKLNDARALPLLIRLSQRPRGGCGKKGREDCLACLRKPLSQLIEALEQKRLDTPKKL